MRCHGFLLGSLGQMAGLHTCIPVGEPARVRNRIVLIMPLQITLYPAAYPRPGNREKNLFPKETCALSLKITEFNCAAEVIWQIISALLLIDIPLQSN